MGVQEKKYMQYKCRLYEICSRKIQQNHHGTAGFVILVRSVLCVCVCVCVCVFFFFFKYVDLL